MSVINKIKNTLNITRHSEHSEESIGRTFKTPRYSYGAETGRSMVEMLGVLAIVGVLSVGGVYGYGVAMKKHKANQLLHEASMHAAGISAQIMCGKDLSKLQNFDSGFATFLEEISRPNSDQFVLTAKDVDPAVCEQMQAMKGSVVREVVCGATDANGKTSTTLTFNNDLSKKAVASDYNKDTTGSECEKAGYKWCNGLSTPACKKDCCSGVTLNSCQESCDSSTGEITPKDDGTECTTSDGKEGTCSDGVCEETADYTGVECTDYQNNTECGGVGSGWYCKFDPSSCSASGTGTCKVVVSGTPIKDGAYLKSPIKMDWWSAQSWCKGNVMDLITGTITTADGTEIQLNSMYENYDGKGPLYNYFGANSVWTGHDKGNSCTAWLVNVTSANEFVRNNYSRHAKYYALCQ